MIIPMEMALSLMRSVMAIVVGVMHIPVSILSSSSTRFLKTASDLVAFMMLKDQY